MLQNYPQTISVAFHGMGSSEKFNSYQGDSIAGTFPNVEFAAFLDGIGHEIHILELEDTIARRYIEQPETPVIIEIDSKIWDPENRMINLTLAIKNDGYGSDLQGTYWYNVMVTENHLIEPHNTWPHCSTPNTLFGPHRDTLYVNDWVARKLVYWSQGRYLAGPTWPYQQEITISDTFSIAPAWIAENCNIIVNVYKKEDSLYQSPVMQAIRTPLLDLSDIPEVVFNEKEILKIYPNPVTSVANIHYEISKEGVCSLDIYDLNGRKIKNLLNGYLKRGLYNLEIQARELPEGMNILMLRSNSGKTSKRLIIM